MQDDPGIPVCDKCGRQHLTPTGLPACKAHSKRTGEPCQNPPIRGAATCRMHGSSNAVSRQAGKRRELEQLTEGRVAKLLKECRIPDQHPLDGLLEVVRHSGEMFRLLGALVGELDVEWAQYELAGADSYGNPVMKPVGLTGPDKDGEQGAHILLSMYGTWADRYARACKLALDANIDERMVRNAEATSAALFTAVGRALEAAQLTPDQKMRLQSSLAQELRKVQGPGLPTPRNL